MVATFKEAIDVVIDLYKDNWNRGNTDNYKPIVIDIAETVRLRHNEDKHHSRYAYC